MASTTFQVYIGTTWTTPPDDAKPAGIGNPVLDYAPVVRYNEPTYRTGNGLPAGIVTELWAEIGRPRINASGLSWWYNTVGIGENSSVYKGVALYNLRTQQWEQYYGYLWQPTFTRGMAGLWFLDFRIRITGLVKF